MQSAAGFGSTLPDYTQHMLAVAAITFPLAVIFVLRVMLLGFDLIATYAFAGIRVDCMVFILGANNLATAAQIVFLTAYNLMGMLLLII